MAKRTCSIEGCDGASLARGWCGKHWQRWRTHGDPLAGGVFHAPRPDTSECSVPGCWRPIKNNRLVLCGTHYMRWRTNGDVRADVPVTPKPSTRHLAPWQRFVRMVTVPGSVWGCWLWDGYLSEKGYGSFGIDGGQMPVHRWVYGHLVGPIPPGLVIDHLCEVRCCVNPMHMVATTAYENTMRSRYGPTAINARKTHCPQGHELTADNTYIIPSTGSRSCRTCRARQARERRRQ